MKILIAGIKKEWMEVCRTKKLMALSAMALFFALLDPVMLKLTPYLLKEFSGVELGEMIQLTQIAELIDFHQDMAQIYAIVLVIIMSNVWINEVKQQTLVMPVSKGVNSADIILAKILTYALIIMGLMIIAYSTNYYYAGIIFGFRVDYYQVLTSALMMGIFYTSCIAFIITLSVLLMNGPAVIFMTLLAIFGGPFLASLLKVEVYTPYALLNEAKNFPRMLPDTIVLTIVCVLILTVIVYYIGTIFANKKEIIKYR
jgi:ABC-2 type transport system permease protein